MPEITTPDRSNAAIDQKYECVKNLNTFLAECEVLKMRGFYSADAFYEFHKNLRMLYNLTQHETTLKQVKYGKIPLLDVIKYYFKLDERTKIDKFDFAVKITGEYIKALATHSLIKTR